MASGRLFVVATPIGNLEDMSPRAVRILREVDLIAAEDTRHSKHLLEAHGISTPLTSYHEHNEITKAASLVQQLEDGRNIALITDAGTPCVSDPGYRIVRAARDRGISVVAVPGPSALVAALSVSGLPSDRFAFHGFFPRKKRQAEEFLAGIREWRGVHAWYESPNRLMATLACMSAALPDVEIAVARELTKKFEEVVTGTPKQVAAHFHEAPVRGELVVLVHIPEHATKDDEPSPDRLRALVEDIVTRDGVSRRDAVRRVSEELRLPRNKVYEAATRKP